MKFNLNSPTIMSMVILFGIMLCAGAYGIATYSGQAGKRNFAPDADFSFPYNVRTPDQVYTLPNDLQEISGIDILDETRIIAVQDENAIVYVYNLEEEKIEEEINFGKNRDYEGIALVDSTIYVLEMDGDLWKINKHAGKDADTDKFETLFTYKNNTEGLCYDPKHNRLLISPKDANLNSSADKREVYAFDLESKQLSPNPVYSVDTYELGQLVYGKRRNYNFKPSDLAVHPKTGNIYILASVGKILVILDEGNEIIRVEMLDRNLLRQPEGITFNSAGDMFISSEGKGGAAIIARYKPESI